MSEIHCSFMLRWQIDRLDEQVSKWCEIEKNERWRRWFLGNAEYVRELYLTGKLRPQKLSEYRAPVVLLDDFLQWFPASDSFGTLDIPEEILFPKPKPGRPQKYDRFTVSQFGCSERHARRLVAAKKGLERQRRTPSPLEQLVLEKHRERKVLMRELKVESRIDALALGIDRLYWTAGRYVNCSQSRKIAKEIIERTGSVVAALVLVGFGIGKDLGFASGTLKCSEITVRRTLKEKLGALRGAGKGLPQFVAKGGEIQDLFKPYTSAQPNRCETIEEESAWETQTQYRQRRTFAQ